MGQLTGKTSRCPACAAIGRDKSEDNLHHYMDGSSHCHACGYDQQPNRKSNNDNMEYGMLVLKDIPKLPIEALDCRGISEEAARKYRVRSEINPETGKVEAYHFPLTKDGKRPCGTQRKAAKGPGERGNGDTRRIGKTQGVLPFGAHLYPNGGGKRWIVVTEGGEDCLAAYDLLAEKGKDFGVVSVLGTTGWRTTLNTSRASVGC